MTSLFRTRARAEEFAALLDGRLAAGDASAESRALAGVATLLKSPEQVTPRADFTADLRERLMAEAATVLTPSDVSHASLLLPARPRGRERKLVALAAAVVVVGGSASMAVAAQSALPGEALYPVKRGLEHAQAGLSSSPTGKGHDLLHQADDRLAEAQGLLAGSTAGDAFEVPGTIADFTSQAQEGSGLLMQAFQSDSDPASIVAVRTFAARGIATLQDLARTAPPDAQAELARAATTLSEIDAQARGLCSTCASDLPDLDVPPMFLAAAEVNRALRAAKVDKLDNSHPVVTDKSLLDTLAGALPKPGALSSSAPTPKQPSAGTTPQPSNPGPSLLPPLPGTDESAKTGTTDLGKTVKKLTNDLTTPLSTLLPDADPDNLLP